MNALFADRAAAGVQLARALAHLQGRPGLLLLALPRGGVPVAYPVAQGLHAPLDVLLVRKLGMPGQEELAVGAIASGGARVLNPEVASWVDPAALARIEARERAELLRRERAFRGDRPPLDVAGRTVIVIDDGAATGATLRAGLAALRGQGPAHLVAAIPVAPPETAEVLAKEADELICLHTPRHFYGVGQWYGDFGQTSDDEVRELLERARDGA
ncbi:phosphoribosyltransferase [Ectothiorhodospiraceae bacterium 2226]|nr:phosphoribosyltransferase [Ectothiorhodospiraceae bacterium 2226]